jgi:hypothetical protein
VATGAFLAAVYLAADARRLRASDLADAFRLRALASGAAAGAIAIAGLIVIDHDAHRLYGGLTGGWVLTSVIVSGLGGIASFILVWFRRYGVARASAAVAVAAVLFGWAAAQRPFVLPGLTLSEAAAGNATMIAILISIGIGVVVLFPSLALLFRLSLSGVFDPAALRVRHREPGPDAPRPSWSGRAAIGFLLIGVVLLTIADSPIAHIFGVIAFAMAGVAGFTAVGPDVLAAQDQPCLLNHPPNDAGTDHTLHGARPRRSAVARPAAAVVGNAPKRAVKLRGTYGSDAGTSCGARDRRMGHLWRPVLYAEASRQSSGTATRGDPISPARRGSRRDRRRRRYASRVAVTMVTDADSAGPCPHSMLAVIPGAIWAQMSTSCAGIERVARCRPNAPDVTLPDAPVSGARSRRARAADHSRQGPDEARLASLRCRRASGRTIWAGAAGADAAEAGEQHGSRFQRKPLRRRGPARD